MKRVAIYLRVSTDKQTTENQLRELQGVGDDVGHRRIVRVNDLTVARPGWACCAERSFHPPAPPPVGQRPAHFTNASGYGTPAFAGTTQVL